MKYLLLLLPFSLCSCTSVGIGQNDWIEADIGYYKKASPFDSDSQFGAFLSKPKTINPVK